MKVKLGFTLYLKLYNRGKLVERAHTCIQREIGYRQGEIQSVDLARNMEDREASSPS